jgi:hypothetical protein
VARPSVTSERIDNVARRRCCAALNNTNINNAAFGANGLGNTQVNGGLASGFLQRNNIAPTVGLRFRF